MGSADIPLHSLLGPEPRISSSWSNMAASTVSPPVHWTLSLVSWTGSVVLDIENSDDFLRENRSIPAIPLVVKLGPSGEEMTWNISIARTENRKLGFWFEFLDGPQENEDCKVRIEISAPGTSLFVKIPSRTTQVKKKETYQVGDVTEDQWRNTTSDTSKGVRRISVELTVLRGCKLEKGTSAVFLAEKMVKSKVLKQDDVSKKQDDTWMSALFNNSLHSDVTIKCGDQIFPAHKIILARNATFAKLLEEDLAESSTSVIYVEDLEPSVLEFILKCIYTVRPELPSDLKDIFEILAGAEAYEVPSLESLCIEELVDTVRDENMGEIAVAVQNNCSSQKAQLIFKSLFNKLSKVVANVAQN